MAVTVVNVVLYQPENPHNTGAIVRTCVLLGARVHLVKPYGFASLDGDVRRASMSYLDEADLIEHPSWDAFVGSVCGGSRVFAFWDRGEACHSEVLYRTGDYLLFGRESVGLPDNITSRLTTVRVDMPGAVHFDRSDHREHSLNVSVTVGIAVAEANRSLLHD